MLDFAKNERSPKSEPRTSPSREERSRPPQDGYPHVYWLNDETLAIDWFGKIDEDKCRYALSRLNALMAARSPRYFFSDTSRATHYVPAVRHRAADILGALRSAGVSEMTAVLNNPPIRVFTAAVARLSGLELKTFHLREDAVRVVSARLSH